MALLSPASHFSKGGNDAVYYLYSKDARIPTAFSMQAIGNSQEWKGSRNAQQNR